MQRWGTTARSGSSYYGMMKLLIVYLYRYGCAVVNTIKPILMKKLLLLTLLVFTFNVVSYSQVVPVSGRIAYYQFNGNANDSSGNNYHMTVYGPTLSTDRYGRTNKAYHFDGIDDYISLNTVLPFGNNFTYSTWFLSESFAYRGRIMHNGNGLLDGIGILQNNGSTWPAANDPGDQITLYAGGVNYYSSQTTTLNDWHHLVVRCSNGVYEYFYDNVLIWSGNAYPNAPTGTFHIGYDYINGGVGFKGKLDDITVYNRALTLAEIDTLFHGCGPQINLQPTNVSVLQGMNAKFYVQGNATQASYQWQMNVGTGFVNLSNAGSFSGVNIDTLRITNASQTLNSNYFRVIVINDVNCSDTSSGAKLTVSPTGIEDVSNPYSFSVYPNPAQGGFTIDLNAKGKLDGQLHIYDVEGRLVYEKSIRGVNGHCSINKQLNKGVYFVSFSRGPEGIVERQKLIIE
jgi:hypothetical protein